MCPQLAGWDTGSADIIGFRISLSRPFYFELYFGKYRMVFLVFLHVCCQCHNKLGNLHSCCGLEMRSLHRITYVCRHASAAHLEQSKYSPCISKAFTIKSRIHSFHSLTDTALCCSVLLLSFCIRLLLNALQEVSYRKPLHCQHGYHCIDLCIQGIMSVLIDRHSLSLWLNACKTYLTANSWIVPCYSCDAMARSSCCARRLCFTWC